MSSTGLQLGTRILEGVHIIVARGLKIHVVTICSTVITRSDSFSQRYKASSAAEPADAFAKDAAKPAETRTKIRGP